MNSKDLTLLERLVETNTRNISDLTKTVAEQGVNINNLLKAMQDNMHYQTKIEHLETELQTIKASSSKRQKILVAVLIGVISAAITGYLSNPINFNKSSPAPAPIAVTSTPAPITPTAPIKP